MFGYSYYGGYNAGYRNYIHNLKNNQKLGISVTAQNKLTALAQGKTVHGVVFDAQGYALPGAVVKVGKLSTNTNYLGIYSINANVGDELTIMNIGFNTLKIKVGQKDRYGLIIAKFLYSKKIIMRIVEAV